MSLQIYKKSFRVSLQFIITFLDTHPAQNINRKRKDIQVVSQQISVKKLLHRIIFILLYISPSSFSETALKPKISLVSVKFAEST